MFFANRESIPGRNNLPISRTPKYYMDLRLYLLFSNINIDFQIKTLNSMRLHNNKDSTKFCLHLNCRRSNFIHVVPVANHINCLCWFCLFVFILCLVYSMLPVSLDYPFLIDPSVFPDVYLGYELCSLLNTPP
jgi:hypothetical protein